MFGCLGGGQLTRINPVSAQQRANAVFESHAADGKVWLRLTKAVRAGEEITVKYGRKYSRNYATA